MSQKFLALHSNKPSLLGEGGRRSLTDEAYQNYFKKFRYVYLHTHSTKGQFARGLPYTLVNQMTERKFDKMYDIIVVGAGPAGLTAALYARRAEKSVLVIEKDTFGGQITHSPRVENYPGFLAMSGNEFADKLIEQVMAQGAEIELDKVVGIEGEAGGYTVLCEGKSYQAKAVIIAAGSHHRQLGLSKENDFVGEGIS